MAQWGIAMLTSPTNVDVPLTALHKARFFLLVDLRDFFSDLGSGDEKKINKKVLKMTS